MKSLFVSFASLLGVLFAQTTNVGCPIVLIDEPEMPKCMIEK